MKRAVSPKITAISGRIIAEKMIEEDKSFINLDLGSEIPKELFEIVAKVLVFVETVDEKK
ncbi:hypothetical protein [Tepidibacter thalassicus]|uniref:Flagellar biosynthesis protein n=1 Tax=Tepidibacter thalassicus DSM 15285 TaxID=1123350 RepID=A0A1M5R464_9FIRM|nr:hypothetical protein [Tepidibacter thalassicus]SHH21122.1 flagellar biosynthesis protein [Tepidibacter thalassicus DSM 15285]